IPVDPYRRYPRGSSELSHRFDQTIRGAITVGFAVEMATAACREADDRPDRARILAGKRDRALAAAGLTDDNHVIPLDEWQGRHVVDYPHVEPRNREPGISEIGVRAVANAR